MKTIYTVIVDWHADVASCSMAFSKDEDAKVEVIKLEEIIPSSEASIYYNTTSLKED